MLGIQLTKYTDSNCRLPQSNEKDELKGIMSLVFFFSISNFVSSWNFSALFAHQIENQYGERAGRAVEMNGETDKTAAVTVATAAAAVAIC